MPLTKDHVYNDFTEKENHFSCDHCNKLYKLAMESPVASSHGIVSEAPPLPASLSAKKPRLQKEGADGVRLPEELARNVFTSGK